MFFTKPYRVRLTIPIIRDIDKIIEEDDGETYDSISHFIRCAIISLIREEKKGWKK